MRYQVISMFLIASICGAQTPAATPASVANPSTQTPTAPADTITVAQGTTVALTLVSAIKSKSSKPGDSVRAVVAFPVTVGTQIAIPAGTYVEGMVNALTARAPHTHAPDVRIHFTRLLFANGYSVPLDAANTEAFVIVPDANLQAPYEIADARDGAPFLGAGFKPVAQTTTEPPPLPRVGPNPAVVVGATLGGMVGLGTLLFVLSHNRGKNVDYLLYDNGWQFQMVLQSPLVLNAAKSCGGSGNARGSVISYEASESICSRAAAI
jgi:hypothetical protein